MKPYVYSKNDYAGITAKNFIAHYGYEVEDGNEEWCFQASFNDETITIPFSKLKGDDPFNCEHNLMLGIAWLMMKYKITL